MQDNKYQITKTVRFKLEPEFDDSKLIDGIVTDAHKRDIDNSSTIEAFITVMGEIISSFKNCLYFHNFDSQKQQSFSKYNNKKEYEKDGLFVIEIANEKKLHIWNKILKVKYSWLRRYLQDQFYEMKNKLESEGEKVPTDYEINSLDYLKETFEKDWLPRFVRVKEELEQIKNEKQESHSKNTATAILVNKLMRRTYSEFLYSFVESLCATNKPDIDNSVDRFKNTLKNYKEELIKLHSYYLPLQSQGIDLLSGSFNYYTINKKTSLLKDRKKEELGKLKHIIDLSVYPNFRKPTLEPSLQGATINEAYSIVKEWKSNKKSLFLELLRNGNTQEAETIEPFNPNLYDNTYDFDILAEYAKNIQLCSDMLSTKKDDFDYEKLTQEQKVYLGKTFDDLSSLIKDNAALRKKIKDEHNRIKPLISEYFDAIKANKGMSGYYKVCDDYKNLALSRGRSIAKISAIEKEEQIIEKLKYFAVIVDYGSDQYLYMIERTGNDKTKHAHDKLSEFSSGTTKDSVRVHYFESLTLSAVRKLCFGKADSSFIIDLKKTMNRTINNTTDERKKTEIQSDLNKLNFSYEQAMTDAQKIEYYKTVLKYSKTLDLEEFNIQEIIKQNYNTIKDFEIALNSICYAKTIKTDASIDDFLKKDCNALKFKITSLDIRNTKLMEDYYENDKGDEYIGHKKNTLTKLWEQFWTKSNAQGNFDFRINPEIKIFWRDAKESRIRKYGVDSKKSNRYLHAQYTAAFNMSINSLSQKINYAFENTNDKGETIKDFNDYVKNNIKTSFALGIDAGKIELATVAGARNVSGLIVPIPFRVLNIKYEKRGFEKKGYLKDGTERKEPYRLIDNPSYFLNKDLYFKTFFKKNDTISYEEKVRLFEEDKNSLFETKITTAIDITIAKCINGEIILNGDYKTFEKLRFLHAQRAINEALKIDKEANLIIDNKKLAKDCLVLIEKNTDTLKLNEKQEERRARAIYNWRGNHNVITSFDEVAKKLKEVYDNLKAFYKDPNGYLADKNSKYLFDGVRLDENINNTRRSMVANMVGVIHAIYKQCKDTFGTEGAICMENFDPNTLESHRKDFEGDILRPLELGLYKKFQNECLVPPISELLKIRSYQKDTDGFTNFGIIKFVDRDETSTTCPKCGNKPYTSQALKEDKEKGIFHCTYCEFLVHKDAKKVSEDDCKDIFGKLNDNDKIAAFNIAKRAFAPDFGPKTITNEIQKEIDSLSIDKSIEKTIQVATDSKTKLGQENKISDKERGKNSYLNRTNNNKNVKKGGRKGKR